MLTIGCQSVRTSSKHPIPLAEYLTTIDDVDPKDEDHVFVRPIGIRLPVGSSESLIFDVLLNCPKGETGSFAVALMAMVRENPNLWVEVRRPDGESAKLLTHRSSSWFRHPSPYGWYRNSLETDAQRNLVLVQLRIKTSIFTQFQGGRYRVRLLPNPDYEIAMSTRRYSATGQFLTHTCPHDVDTSWHEFELVRADIEPNAARSGFPGATSQRSGQRRPLR